MAREIRRDVAREVATVEKKQRSWGRTITWFVLALLLALSAGGLTGVLASYYLNNSRYALEVSALATYRPPQVTTIYADDGETVLAEFAIEKRKYPSPKLPKAVPERAATPASSKRASASFLEGHPVLMMLGKV